jgi:hypothetical protein
LTAGLAPGLNNTDALRQLLKNELGPKGDMYGLSITEPYVMVLGIWSCNWIELRKVPLCYFRRNMQSGVCLWRRSERSDHVVLNSTSRLSLVVVKKPRKSLPARAGGANNGFRCSLELDNEL